MEELVKLALELSQKPEDYLYLEIGHLYGGQTGSPLLPRQQIDLARAWFTARRQQLANAVCGNPHVQLVAKQDVATHEVIITISGILDLASHLLGGVPAVTVAALIVSSVHESCRSLKADTGRSRAAEVNHDDTGSW